MGHLGQLGSSSYSPFESAYERDLRIRREMRDFSYEEHRRKRDMEFHRSMSPSYMDPLQMELEEKKLKEALEKIRKKKLILLL